MREVPEENLLHFFLAVECRLWEAQLDLLQQGLGDALGGPERPCKPKALEGLILTEEGRLRVVPG